MRKSKSKKRDVNVDELYDEEDDIPLVSKATEKEYEVEKIVSSRKKKGNVEYLVRWKGYSEADDTWENKSNLNCPELIKAFQEECKDNDSPFTSAKLEKRGQKRGSQRKLKSREEKKTKEGNASDTTDDEEYEVEKILEVHHKKDGSREFLVRWKGYSKNDDTWEPERHLNCQKLIDAFLLKVSKAKEATQRETRVNRKATDRYVINSPDSRRRLSGRNSGARRTYYDN